MLIRSFIALYPDPAAREEMARVVSCLRERERAVRWEAPEKIHITMKFLGDVEAAALDAIALSLREALCQPRPSEGGTAVLSSGDIQGVIDVTGGFPDLRRPRIVWLGFSRPPAEIAVLQEVVESACEAEGVAREHRRFTPHFTIGRVRQGADTAGLEKALQACSFQPFPVRFTRLCLMESTLTPTGAIHTERNHFLLTPGE